MRVPPANQDTTERHCIINNEQRFWYTFCLRQDDLLRLED